MVDVIGRLEALVERVYERGIVRRDQPRWPPLFVVGTPRSGTTVVYQHLIHTFRCAYVPNIAERHPTAPVAAARLGVMLGDRDTSYESDFGETEGALGPSDGWELFHRWFPRYDLGAPIDDEVFTALPRIIAGLEQVFVGPFFNKNNHNSVRLETLLRACPNAIVLRVTRAPEQTAMSLLGARRTHHVGLDEWWSCPAPTLLDHAFESQTQQAAATVADIEAHLDREMDKLDPDRGLEVEYEAFCEAPDALIDAVEERYSRAGIDLERRPDRPAPSLHASVRDEIPAEITEALERFGRPGG